LRPARCTIASVDADRKLEHGKGLAAVVRQHRYGFGGEVTLEVGLLMLPADGVSSVVVQP
jgi:hypothetical protein